MGIFKKKSGKYVDLSEKMRKQQERINDFKSENLEVKKEDTLASGGSSGGGGFFSFFGGGTNASSTASSSSDLESPEEKRKKLAKKLSDMTAKMEDLENQIYHLKQRVEVLERKQKIGY